MWYALENSMLNSITERRTKFETSHRCGDGDISIRIKIYRGEHLLLSTMYVFLTTTPVYALKYIIEF